MQGGGKSAPPTPMAERRERIPAGDRETEEKRNMDAKTQQSAERGYREIHVRCVESTGKTELHLPPGNNRYRYR